VERIRDEYERDEVLRTEETQKFMLETREIYRKELEALKFEIIDMNKKMSLD
jgi:hypothetical protein